MRGVKHITCPMERRVNDALEQAGVMFVHESQDNKATNGLDFYLPHLNLYIEVKQFHTDRIAEQMSRVDNVIAVQGEYAVNAFCALLRGRELKA